MLNTIKKYLFKKLYKQIEDLKQEKEKLYQEFQEFKIKSQETIDKTNKYYKGKIKGLTEGNKLSTKRMKGV